MSTTITRNPVGRADSKTASWGTYRPVGPTCPPDCPLLDLGCYAQTGNVALHQRRASAEAGPAVEAFDFALYNAKREGGIVRLHVSGDFGRTWDQARPYITELCRTAKRYGGDHKHVVAWSYTHLSYTLQGRYWQARMLAAGIVVRWSTRHDVAYGVKVLATRQPNHRANDEAWRVAIRQAKDEASKANGIVCPAQIGDTTCARCRACWTVADRPIAFLASTKAAATAAKGE